MNKISFDFISIIIRPIISERANNSYMNVVVKRTPATTPLNLYFFFIAFIAMNIKHLTKNTKTTSIIGTARRKFKDDLRSASISSRVTPSKLILLSRMYYTRSPHNFSISPFALAIIMQLIMCMINPTMSVRKMRRTPTFNLQQQQQVSPIYI